MKYEKKKRYTQSGGVRPFGISMLIAGFDPHDGQPSLYQTEPSGTYSAWKANATGRNSKTVTEFLEKHYDTSSHDEHGSIKLAVRALLEVVEAGNKNIEVAILQHKKPLHFLSEERIDEFVKEIESEKTEKK